GVSWMLNDPFAGGTHLPDITVITPVFAAGSLIGFAASRAHHADVGGSRPGSMPADSRRLSEEGVVIHPRVVSQEAIEEIVAQTQQPARLREDQHGPVATIRYRAVGLAEVARSPTADRLRSAA